MSEIETLTDEERAYLELDGLDATPTAKALRVIDADAADRAALVAQLEAAELSHRQALNIEAAEVSRWKDLAHDANAARVALDGRVLALVAQVAELTRERDEARADYKQAAEAYKQACAELNDTEAEVARLTEALAAAERTSAFEGGVRDRRRAEAAEARVRELEARIEEARAAMTMAFGPFLVNWPQGARDAAEALRG